ncbi:hypothetical protein [Streptomyces bikiniensis]|uniref:hypothetical protein n=1 Tax=Streptomyces bikiniensis TaxID=1896 RepID=UPI0004C1BE14|nr:hypothetical protein [Streptomyces bikiniensis]
MRSTVFRWTAWVAGALALGLLVTWIWWRESDTAARWRFEEAMKTYCGGVLAYEEGPLFEGLGHEVALRGDHSPRKDAHTCWLGTSRRQVVVALLPGGDPGPGELRDTLPPLRDRVLLPLPLGGGWRGWIDGSSARVLLDCRGSADRVAVTVEMTSRLREEDAEKVFAEPERMWEDTDHLFGTRFALATAVKAAGHWGCEAETGKPLTSLPEVTRDEEAERADGTCAGLPFALDRRLDTVWETAVDRSAVYEICEVEASGHFTENPYSFSARFGPYALAARREGDFRDTAGGVGARGGTLWASARCPGDTERALFTGSVPPEAFTAWFPDEKGGETFGLPAFHEFAKRSAERHGCTDLRLPKPR